MKLRNFKVLQKETIDVPAVQEEKMKLSKKSQLLYTQDSQATLMKNLIRAAINDDSKLTEELIKTKDKIPSLIAAWSPELKASPFELAIKYESLNVLQLLIEQEDADEPLFRCKKEELFAKKFDTGEVNELAFGTKVRKVQMMRGNRQGNNAFMEEPTHEFTSIG